MGMAVCKGWSHLSKPKQGVNYMDQSCSEDISPVSLLNHRKGITQGTTVYTHPLPTAARTFRNCHLLQEAIIWGWKNLWCSLLSQNKINFTTLEVSFQSPVPLIWRYSEDDVQSTLFASLEDHEIGNFLRCFMPETPALWYIHTSICTHGKLRWQR